MLKSISDNLSKDEIDNMLLESIKSKSLEERAIEFGDELGPYKEFDWGKPLGREIW